MSKKRYTETTYENNALADLLTGQDGSRWTTVVKDRETGKTGRDTSYDKGKSIEGAHKDLREK